jgi:hypothetical protein
VAKSDVHVPKLSNTKAALHCLHVAHSALVMLLCTHCLVFADALSADSIAYPQHPHVELTVSTLAAQKLNT